MFIGHLARLKLAAAPTDKHRLWLSANTDPATIENTAGGNARLGVAENRQRQGGIFGVAGWEWRLSENIIPSIQVGVLQSFLDIGPMGWYGSSTPPGATSSTRSTAPTIETARATRTVPTTRSGTRATPGRTTAATGCNRPQR